jgi:hypothetical protein
MRRTALALLIGLLATAAFATSAKAAIQIESFDTTASSSLAGDHPDLSTDFELGDSDTGVAKTVVFNAPQGIFGNPNVLSLCTALDFAQQKCAPNSQSGLITIRADYEGDSDRLLGTVPIYAVEPSPDDAARFAFYAPILEIPISIPVSVRSGTDYGLRFTVSGITQLVPLKQVDMIFWGFPSSPEHNMERFAKASAEDPAGCVGLEDTSCITEPTASTVPLAPFTGYPSVCNRAMKTTLDVESYQEPGVFAHAESSYPLVTECERQTFLPVAQGELTSDESDSPSGLDLVFTIPQAQGIPASPSQLRTGELILPEGLTINPDAADGQSACSDSDAELGNEKQSHCPDNAKVGTIVIQSDSLPGDLQGSIYFGQPVPGNQYRLFMIADGFGIHAKLIGKLLPDPKTGQVTARFEDLPQLPFEQFSMHLFASDRGVLATPTHCSIYPVQTRLFPWNSKLPDENAQFILSVNRGPGGAGCPGGTRPFQPRLNAGTSNPNAGGFSNFTLKLDRDDGDQFLGDLNFKMPPGLTASLRGLTYCPEASIAAAAQNLGRTELAAPSCPSSSQIGTTNVAAGPGSHPFHATGSMYLAGPLKGGQLSLAAITPALAGPYDYGVVVVRVAINIDSLDAHVIAVSETIPSIIGGIPLRMRSIQVNIDRPNFMINPTNCRPMTVDSQGIGDQGSVVGFSSYFQAANCAPLPFAPKMSVRKVGKGATGRSKDPSLEFRLRTRAGDANIKSLSVTLSKAFSIDQRHLGNLCSEAEFAATKCAGRAAIGTATTTTPLLDQPLGGKVYAVSGKGGLPRLAFILDGQVSLAPRAESLSTRGALKTTVPVVPDAPIGDFRLSLYGGKKGYITNTRSLCGKPPVTTVEYEAQNGKRLSQKVRMKVPCGGGSSSKKKRR